MNTNQLESLFARYRTSKVMCEYMDHPECNLSPKKKASTHTHPMCLCDVPRKKYDPVQAKDGPQDNILRYAIKLLAEPSPAAPSLRSSLRHRRAHATILRCQSLSTISVSLASEPVRHELKQRGWSRGCTPCAGDDCVGRHTGRERSSRREELAVACAQIRVYPSIIEDAWIQEGFQTERSREQPRGQVHGHWQWQRIHSAKP